MSEQMAVYQTEGQEGLAVRKSDELSLTVLKEFLHEWRQGGDTVQTFSAAGIRYMAIELGISVVSSDFKECSDGKGLYFSATARNMHTGQEYVAHVWQSKTTRKGAFDPDAIAKGSTRVARNAIAGLLPLQVLKHRVLDAIKKGEVEASQMVEAQSAARRMLGKQRAKLQATFGITPAEAFERAQSRIGESEHWDYTHWDNFTRAVESLDAEWFGDESS